MIILAGILWRSDFFGSGPGFVNRTQSDPGFVNPVRSGPGFVDPIRSDPVQVLSTPFVGEMAIILVTFYQLRNFFFPLRAFLYETRELFRYFRLLYRRTARPSQRILYKSVAGFALSALSTTRRTHNFIR